MSQDAGGRYSIQHAGALIEVEAPVAAEKNTARLYVDGDKVDEQTVGFGEKATLTLDDATIEVQWWWTDKVGRCQLVERGPVDPTSTDDPPTERTPLDPPPGTRAARLAELQRAHPVAYASRHVVIAVGQVAFVVLGLGVLLKALLPRIDLSWLPELNLPDLPLPEIPWPDIALPDLAAPAWLAAILETKTWWLPIVIAIFVAVREVDRRKKRAAARAARERDADPEGSG